MKATLIQICILYFLAGATIYVGTLWCMRLFLYRSWRGLTQSNVAVHFAGPTKAATKFFTAVVPPMMAAGIVPIVHSWGHTEVWPAIVAELGIATSTFVGALFILPVNYKIDAGPPDAVLQPLLHRWMFLNDIRFYSTTVTWVAAVWYIAAVADLHGALQ